MKLLIAITAFVVSPHGTPFRPLPGMKKAACGWRQRRLSQTACFGIVLLLC
jgi:hypothetical protein